MVLVAVLVLPCVFGLYCVTLKCVLPPDWFVLYTGIVVWKAFAALHGILQKDCQLTTGGILSGQIVMVVMCIVCDIAGLFWPSRCHTSILT